MASPTDLPPHIQAALDELARKALEDIVSGVIGDPLRAFESMFSTTAKGGPKAFADRDFGRWNRKAQARQSDEADAFAYAFGGSPTRSDYTSFKETNKEGAANPRPGRILLSRAYLAVSEEPPVAVAAVQLRVAIEAERRAFWKVGADGRRVYSSAWFEDGGPALLELAERKLRRRVKAALIRTTPSGEPSLW